MYKGVIKPKEESVINPTDISLGYQTTLNTEPNQLDYRGYGFDGKDSKILGNEMLGKCQHLLDDIKYTQSSKKLDLKQANTSIKKYKTDIESLENFKEFYTYHKDNFKDNITQKEIKELFEQHIKDEKVDFVFTTTYMLLL